jgi:hypothetical protein
MLAAGRATGRGAAAVARLTPASLARHWRLAPLLGEHGVLNTNQVAVLLAGDQPLPGLG